jgi:Fic family protein
MARYRFLAEYGIPHEIEHSDRFVHHLMRIAACKPFFDEQLGTKLELSLVRKAKIRAITYSNQIEGNPLGEAEVTAILDGKRVAGSPKAIREVRNYEQALSFVEELSRDARKLRLADFFDVQKLLTAGLLEDSQRGRARTVPVSIVNATTKDIIQECPEPHALRDLLDDLWQWLDDTRDLNPFARAFAFHFIAVSIHPFADGNGRSVRLMQHLLLLKSSQTVARFVPSETAIMRSRDRYYSALQNSRKLGSLRPIFEFLAECFADAAEQSVAEAKAEFSARSQSSTAKLSPAERRKLILGFAAKYSPFSTQMIAEALPQIAQRTLERDLRGLVTAKDLSATGANKGRTYGLRKQARRV